MTVNQLHKILIKLIANGEGRLGVHVSKETFTHNCEDDGVTILKVEKCITRRVLYWNNDTDSYENADGSERTKRVVILVGDSWEPDELEINKP